LCLVNFRAWIINDWGGVQTNIKPGYNWHAWPYWYEVVGGGGGWIGLRGGINGLVYGWVAYSGKKIYYFLGWWRDLINW
jgi:hypothetical protein